MIPLIGGTQGSEIHRDKVECWLPVAVGRRIGSCWVDTVSVWEGGKVLESSGYSMPLNCIPKKWVKQQVLCYLCFF